MPDSSLLPIGKIRKAHGIRGEVSVEYYADSPALLHGGVYLRRAAETPVFHEVASVRTHHGALLIRFASVPDKTAADPLRGYELLLPKNKLPEPDDDSVYVHELIGLSVIATAENGAETFWGTIAGVMEPAGQELWTISLPGEEDILFPAAPEFVLGIDLAEGNVKIAPPPGLFELYRG